MSKILGVFLAAIIGAVTLGTTNQAYAAGNDITREKHEAAFADNYTGYYYKNITNGDKFVAALGDNYNGYYYKNLTNRDKFVVALGDNYTGYYYKNITNMDKFVAALGDDYTPGRYDAIMDKTRFAALLDEKSVEQTAAGNDVPKNCVADRPVDYLSDAIVVAKLIEGCN